MPSQSVRNVRYSHPARRVFAALPDQPAYEVVVYLDELAASPPTTEPRDAWTILASGVRITYRLTADEALAKYIVPPL